MLLVLSPDFTRDKKVSVTDTDSFHLITVLLQSTSQQPLETPHLSTTFHDIGCQTEPPQNMSVGIQSSAPKMRTVGTQLSMGTLRASMRSKGK